MKFRTGLFSMNSTGKPSRPIGILPKTLIPCSCSLLACEFDRPTWRPLIFAVALDPGLFPW